jgi:hypothetical protein
LGSLCGITFAGQVTEARRGSRLELSGLFNSRGLQAGQECSEIAVRPFSPPRLMAMGFWRL